MPRSKTILQSDFPYHVTARCRNREWFKIPMPLVWKIFSQQLTFMNWGFHGKIHAFVLMHNHFHLIVSTPDSNLSEMMCFFMREVTRSLNAETGQINQAFGGPHFRCVIDSYHYFLHCYKYVYANPLKAGLVSKSETYPYSSLNFLIGQAPATFPMVHDDTLFSDLKGTLEWINTLPTEEAWDSVEKALHKARFRLPKINQHRDFNPLEKYKL